MQSFDASTLPPGIDRTATRAARTRPSLRFVAGVSVSLILHGLLLWLLLMPRGGDGPDSIDAVSTLLIEWQQAPAPRPQPVTPAPAVDAQPERTAIAATATLTSASESAVAVHEQPDAEFAPTPQRLAAADVAASTPDTIDAAPAAAAATTPAPSAADAYLWDVLAHLRRFQQYPELARQRDLEGTVWLRARVSRAGVVLRSEIERSSGHALLDRAAARLVAKASPLPMPPPGPYAITDLSLPVEYRLRRE